MRVQTEINRHLKRGRGDLARNVIRRELRQTPQDHWLMKKMAQAYAVDGRLWNALRWSGRALTLEPDCPIACWDRAGILFMLGRDADAVLARAR